MMLGAVLQGVRISGRSYAGGWWDWLTPFTILTGLAVVVGYALLGAAYLMMKTTGPVHVKARGLVWPLVLVLLVGIGAVSAYTPFLETAYWQRWFGWPTILFAGLVPLLVAVTVFGLHRALVSGRQVLPFLLSLVLFAITFAGLGISIYPWVIPGQLTIWDAASPAKSQEFMLWGAAFLIPIILAYTAFSYWVFRGKLDPDEGYH
jgi:cytochrome d ubiquinol oxidase subunit II